MGQDFRGNCDSQGKLGMCPSLAEPDSGGFPKNDFYNVSRETNLMLFFCFPVCCNLHPQCGNRNSNRGIRVKLGSFCRNFLPFLIPNHMQYRCTSNMQNRCGYKLRCGFHLRCQHTAGFPGCPIRQQFLFHWHSFWVVLPVERIFTLHHADLIGVLQSLRSGCQML